MSDGATPAGILHLLLSANEAAWVDCFHACSKADSVVALDAAVMRLANGDVTERFPFPCRLSAAGPDARARGLTAVLERLEIPTVTDAGLIDLIDAHRACLSWR